MSSIRSVSKLRMVPIQRAFSQKSTKKPEQTAPKTGSIDSNVIGLTSYVIKKRAEPLGPGASTTGEYKVPEYFCYDRFSYHGAEVELAKYRLPQPSAKSGQ